MTDQSRRERRDAWPEVLTEAQCRQLLADGVVGRLIWQGEEGLSAQPVNYALDGNDLAVRLSPYSLAARECDRRPVAFEVDQIDPEQRAGWSVLARGRARRVPLPAAHTDVDVWPAGLRAVLLWIEVDRLTGTSLHASALARG